MIIELNGEDWSEITEGSDKFQLFPLENEEKNYDSQAYFPRYQSLFGHEPPPFNLGIYQTPGKDGDTLKATKYIGILPLLKTEGENTPNGELPAAKISSRFSISPTDMLSEVLAGDDYYENPEMLKTRSYSPREWRETAKRGAEEKVLFGLVSGFGDVEVSGSGSGMGSGALDTGIADAYGAFEIIDFVSKAREICRKNLKRQSQRVEENLACKVKGRILVQKQIKYNVVKGQNHKTYCAYNRMSENILENQILKYALHLCGRHPIGDSLGEDIRFCMGTLSGVPLRKVSVADFMGLKNNGAYRQYKDALNAAKKVIGRYSLSYSDQGSDSDQEKEITAKVTGGKVTPYFIDMNLLFEYYCRAIFRKAVDEYNKKPDNPGIPLKLEGSKDGRRRLYEEKSLIRSFYMETYIPDIVITYETDGATKAAAVFDAKYSDVEKQSTEQRARTHQVLFYMKALGCDHGGLISPGNRDEYSSGRILVNGTTTKNGPRLYYIPLGNSKAFDDYVTQAKNALTEIMENIKETEGKTNEQSGK